MRGVGFHVVVTSSDKHKRTLVQLATCTATPSTKMNVSGGGCLAISMQQQDFLRGNAHRLQSKSCANHAAVWLDQNARAGSRFKVATHRFFPFFFFPPFPLYRGTSIEWIFG